jgi:F-type H+-transporting ATPase subunit gamma
MATLREVRRRIGSVTNIAQITRAMEMVAASRMKRAQDAILAARPYSDELREALSRVVAAASEELDPLLARRPVHRIGLVAVTTDRGLVGSLNSNAIRAVLRYVTERAAPGDEGTEIELVTIGRKGRDAFRRAGLHVAAHFPHFGTRPGFADVTPIARLLVQDFVSGRYDEIAIAYSTFISTLTQRPEVRTILPVERPELAEEGRLVNDDYLFEPSPEAVLRRLLPHYVAVDIYRAVLENNASEQSAQMIAMRNATDNAHELIDDLTLLYNKTRQSNITREMIEIASGANALAG